MITTLEAKLSSKDRAELKDSDFGLPKEKRFPINDEAHVRKAIQFFKYCEKTKRNELSLNINKKLREYDLQITVKRSNPFSKYADKKYVTVAENAYDDAYMDSVTSENMDFIKNYPIYSCKEIMALEAWCQVVIDEALEKCLIDDTNSALIESINSYLHNEYNEFSEYCGENANMYNMVEGAKREIIDGLNNIDTLIPKFDTLMNVIESTCNKYHTYRACSEIISSTRYSSGDDMEDALIERYIDEVSSARNRASGGVNSKDIPNILTEYSNPFDMPQKWVGTIQGSDIMDKVYQQTKNDLYIIDKSMDNNIDPKYSDIIVQANRIRAIDENVSTELDSDDSLFLSRVRCKYTYFMYNGKNNFGEDVLFGHDRYGEHHYLITKYPTTEVYDILLIELTPETVHFITSTGRVNEAPNIKVIRVSGSTTHLRKNIDINSIVSEAFAINEDGDIKITISPKNSYMDSYSANHKMLVENWKNKNYDAMKKNLAYVFALIMIIERSDEYKKKDPRAIKARAFAINDFKTYLKHLQSVEPDFDFVEYYDASDYDKKIVNIPRTTVIGIKRLVQSILLPNSISDVLLENGITDKDQAAYRMKQAATTKGDVDSIIASMTSKEREEMSIFTVKGKYEYLSKKEGRKVVARFIHRVGKEPVAFFDLLDVDTHLNAVLGTRRGAAYRNKGYASKCVQQGMDWYRKNKSVINKPIVWWARKDNPGSQRVAEKFGFKVDNNHEYKDKWVKYVYGK